MALSFPLILVRHQKNVPLAPFSKTSDQSQSGSALGWVGLDSSRPAASRLIMTGEALSIEFN